DLGDDAGAALLDGDLELTLALGAALQALGEPLAPRLPLVAVRSEPGDGALELVLLVVRLRHLDPERGVRFGGGVEALHRGVELAELALLGEHAGAIDGGAPRQRAPAIDDLSLERHQLRALARRRRRAAPQVERRQQIIDDPDVTEQPLAELAVVVVERDE